ASTPSSRGSRKFPSTQTPCSSLELEGWRRTSIHRRRYYRVSRLFRLPSTTHVRLVGPRSRCQRNKVRRETSELTYSLNPTHYMGLPDLFQTVTRFATAGSLSSRSKEYPCIAIMRGVFGPA